MISRHVIFALLAALVCISCGLGFGVDVPSAQDSDPNATTGDNGSGDTGIDVPGEGPASGSGGAATGGSGGTETGGAGGEGGSAF